MTEVTLPAMPTSQMNVEVWDSEVKGLHSANSTYFTAEQMQAYAREAVLLERERCAKVCDKLSVSEYPTDCDDCAASIRKG